MKNKSIKYFTSKFFLDSEIKYGFFARTGGCSKKSFDSLNCSFKSKDKKKNVINNINAAKQKIGLKKTMIKLMNQTHGANIEIINNKNISKKKFADGAITIDKNISLAVLTADCAPIFLIDPIDKIICVLHSGWRGCLNNIIFKGTKKIIKINKSLKNIIAIVGPCLSQKNFEVDEKFKKKFLKKNIEYKNFFKKKTKDKKIYFDMRGLITHQLRNCLTKRILHVNFDTYYEENLFYSHRRENHRNALPTGRMINIIGFKQ